MRRVRGPRFAVLGRGRDGRAPVPSSELSTPCPSRKLDLPCAKAVTTALKSSLLDLQPCVNGSIPAAWADGNPPPPDHPARRDCLGPKPPRHRERRAPPADPGAATRRQARPPRRHRPDVLDLPAALRPRMAGLALHCPAGDRDPVAPARISVLLAKAVPRPPGPTAALS
jgi:hypothetical protein